MATVLEAIITPAFKDAGILAAGYTPAGSEAADALILLNQKVQTWNAMAIPIYQVTRSTVALTGAQSYALAVRPVKIKAADVLSTATVDLPLVIADAPTWAAYLDKAGAAAFSELLFYEDGYPLGRIHMAPLVSSGTLVLFSQKQVGSGLAAFRETLNLTGAASYTIGVGGNFATERPAKILGASISAGSSIARGVKLVTAEEWAAFPKRGAGGRFAEILWYDNAYPTGTVWLAPIPATGGTLELFLYLALTEFAGTAETVSLPYGYVRAMRLALAIEIAEGYGYPVSPDLKEKAAEAFAAIVSLNASILGAPAAAPAPAAPVAEAA